MESSESFSSDPLLEVARQEINRWQSVRSSLETTYNNVDIHDEDLLRTLHELLYTVYDMELLVRFCVHEGLAWPETDELLWQHVEAVIVARPLDVAELRTLVQEITAHWHDGLDTLHSEPDEHHGTSERGRYETFKREVPEYDRS